MYDTAVQNHLRAAIVRRSDFELVGAFVAGFDPHSANPFRNWATPAGDGPAGKDDVAALVAAFERRARTPRLEYVPSVSPGLAATLADAGFREHARTTVLVCDRDSLVPHPAPDGFAVDLVTDDARLRAVAEVQHAAYGEPEPPGPADTDRLRLTTRTGGLVALAVERDAGQPVAAGLVTAPIDGLAELAAVATAAAYRRRGVARAISALLTAAALDAGAHLVYLEPEGPAEQRLYEAVGFRAVGEKLAMIR